MSLMTMKKLKTGMCRWPIGDPRNSDFHFCGSPSEYGQSYCEQHTDKAHNDDTRRNTLVRFKNTKKKIS